MRIIDVTDGLLSFLKEMGLDPLYDMFVENDIDMSLAHTLTDEDLKDLGLTLGQRKRYLRSIEASAQSAQSAMGRNKVVPERRQLTVLFADLVGSTRLAAEMDPEDLREAIAGYHQACAAIMRAHGGYVAYHQGDGLMVYFGYPVAAEDDPERAIRAGFELVETVKGLETPAPWPLDARVGIATGVVVAGDMASDNILSQEMVVGETPNLAARLQGFANAGEVVVGASTRQLAANMFDYEPLGIHEMKGFSQPVEVFRVTGESGLESRYEAHGRGQVHEIFGRDAELAELHRRWEGVGGGNGAAALITGPAGIGKSNLALGFAKPIETGGKPVVKWYGAAHLSNRALFPFTREIERQIGFAHQVDEETRRANLHAMVDESPMLTERDYPFLADLVGLGGDEQSLLDPQTRARRTNDALVRRVLGMAAKQPLLMVFEDAHWADPASQELLALLVERLKNASALLLVTCRPQFSPGWREAGHCADIVLSSLDREAGARLIDAVVRDRVLPSVLTARILEKTDGVPLFVEELTKTLLDQALGNTGASASALLDALSIPATLQDSLMARLDRLEIGKDIAQYGAVIGREFTAAMLKVVVDDPSEVDIGLQRLCEAGLAFQGGHLGPEWFVFHHALVQDAAYESMLRRNRREAHRKIAEAMLAGHPAFGAPEPEIIARHCTEAGLREQAVSYWLKAGLDSLDRASNLTALNHLRAALRELEELPASLEKDRLELRIQISLAPASMAIFGWAANEVAECCARARDLALQLEDHESLYGAIWGLWTNYFLRGEMDAALATSEAVDQMAEAAGLGILQTTADHAVGFSHYFRGELDKAIERADRGIGRFSLEEERQIVRMFQFSSTVALHGFRAAALWMRGDDEAATAELHRTLELAEELAHPPSMAFALAFTQYTLMYQRKWKDLESISLRLENISQEEGFQMWIPQARVFKGFCQAANGDLHGAIDQIRENFDLYQGTGTVLTLQQMLPRFGELLIEAGHYQEAVERLTAMIEWTENRAERAYLPELYRVRSEARAAMGKQPESAADRENAINLAADQGARQLLARAQASQAA